VEITELGSKVFGKIIKLYPNPDEDPDPFCDKCPEDDERDNKKIIGLEIIQNMKWSEKELTEGSILDPESGKIYECKIWLEGKRSQSKGLLGAVFSHTNMEKGTLNLHS